MPELRSPLSPGNSVSSRALPPRRRPVQGGQRRSPGRVGDEVASRRARVCAARCAQTSGPAGKRLSAHARLVRTLARGAAASPAPPAAAGTSRSLSRLVTFSRAGFSPGRFRPAALLGVATPTRAGWSSRDRAHAPVRSAGPGTALSQHSSLGRFTAPLRLQGRLPLAPGTLAPRPRGRALLPSVGGWSSGRRPCKDHGETRLPRLMAGRTSPTYVPVVPGPSDRETRAPSDRKGLRGCRFPSSSGSLLDARLSVLTWIEGLFLFQAWILNTPTRAR